MSEDCFDPHSGRCPKRNRTSGTRRLPPASWRRKKSASSLSQASPRGRSTSTDGRTPPFDAHEASIPRHSRGGFPNWPIDRCPKWKCLLHRKDIPGAIAGQLPIPSWSSCCWCRSVGLPRALHGQQDFGQMRAGPFPKPPRRSAPTMGHPVATSPTHSARVPPTAPRQRLPLRLRGLPTEARDRERESESTSGGRRCFRGDDS